MKPIPLLDEPTISLPPGVDFTLPGQREPWDKPKTDDAMEQAFADMFKHGVGTLRQQHVPYQDIFGAQQAATQQGSSITGLLGGVPGLLRKQAE